MRSRIFHALALSPLLLAACSPGADKVISESVDADTGLETAVDTDTGAESAIDADGDGHGADQDCDDDDPEIHPEATELCDGEDNDCDGLTDEDDAVDATTWYTDADGDGYGEATTATTACTQPEGTVASTGDCDDVHGTIYPDAEEICEDGVVNDCNSDTATAMADCGLGGTLSLSEADVKLTAEAASDQAGYAVSGAGDLDGDGLTDLMVASPGEDSGARKAGAVYLLLGGGALDGASGAMSLASADLKLTGEASDDQVGRALSSAGDVDGDGANDLIVGAGFEGSDDTSAGAAYLWLGGGGLLGASGAVGMASADLKLTGEATDDHAGQSVSCAGDVDGDGLDDLAVGAFDPFASDDDIDAFAGAAYLLLGGGALNAASGTLSLGSADLKLTGEGEADQAGNSVSSAGDIDGDGLGDLIVGAYREDSSDTSDTDAVGGAGAAYLLLGRGTMVGTSGTLSLGDSDLKLTGEAESDAAGSSVSDAGDVDGDGLDDVLVGATDRASVGAPYSGAAYLLLGGGALGGASATLSLGSADLRLAGERGSDQAGNAVSGAGDVDGDGRGDVLIGAYGETSGGSSAGAAYLLLSGGALDTALGALSLASADLKLTGEVEEDYAGFSVSGPGDVNGDGFSDLLVGAPVNKIDGSSAGAAYLIFGGGY